MNAAFLYNKQLLENEQNDFSLSEIKENGTRVYKKDSVNRMDGEGEYQVYLPQNTNLIIGGWGDTVNEEGMKEVEQTVAPRQKGETQPIKSMIEEGDSETNDNDFTSPEEAFMHTLRKIKKGNVNDFRFVDEEDKELLSSENDYQQLFTRYKGLTGNSYSAIDYENRKLVDGTLEIDMEDNLFYSGKASVKEI